MNILEKKILTDNIILRCKQLYHAAEAKVGYFKHDDYVWIIGRDVEALLFYDSIYAIKNNDSSNLKELLGIPVQIDYVNPDRITLYKEIK